MVCHILPTVGACLSVRFYISFASDFVFPFFAMPNGRGHEGREEIPGLWRCQEASPTCAGSEGAEGDEGDEGRESCFVLNCVEYVSIICFVYGKSTLGVTQ